MKRFFALLVAASMAVGLLAGCGGSSGGSGGTKLKLATVSPLSAGAVAMGEAIKFGTMVALEEKKAALAKAGYTVEIISKDDQGKPDVGAQVATQLLSDNAVIGIVGTLNSGTAHAIMPKIKDAGLIMVSPANTDVALTESGYANYARVVFRDDYQGPAGARFAYQNLKAKTAFVIHDKTPYGQGLAERWAGEFKKQGGQVVGEAGSDDKQTDFSAIVTNIISKKPDLIFYGGMAQAGANLVKQARDKGFSGPIMGGDGFDDPDLIKLGGAAAEKTYYTSVNVDFSTAEAKKFAESYKKLSGGKEAPAYGAYAYDAALTIINALIEYGSKNGGKAPARADLAKAVRATKGMKGLGGDVTFDAKGDNPGAKVYVFTVKSGKFEAVGPAPAK